MGISGTGHGNRAPVIFNTFIGFIFNRRLGVFTLHIRRKTAPLNHKIWNHPVKYRTVIIFCINVA